MKKNSTLDHSFSLTPPALFKALSEPVRWKIINYISCNEMCACELLDSLSISQSTLSHHMKILTSAGLVNARKEATWYYYSVNKEIVSNLQKAIEQLMSQNENCICNVSKNQKKGCSK